METTNVLDKATVQEGERVNELLWAAKEKMVWSVMIWQTKEGIINADIELTKDIIKVEDGFITKMGPALMNEYLKEDMRGARKLLGEVLYSGLLLISDKEILESYGLNCKVAELDIANGRVMKVRPIA